MQKLSFNDLRIWICKVLPCFYVVNMYIWMFKSSIPYINKPMNIQTKEAWYQVYYSKHLKFHHNINL